MALKHDDGRYYAERNAVWKSPICTKREDGRQSFTMGFRVCTMSDDVGESAAPLVADALNMYAKLDDKWQASKVLHEAALGCNLMRNALGQDPTSAPRVAEALAKMAAVLTELCNKLTPPA